MKSSTRSWWRDRRHDVFALASLCLFFIAFFPQALLGGKYLILNDALFYSYPLRTIAWRMILDGQLPLWTPNIMSGYPLLSMAQLGLAYPLTWGYLFLPGHVAEQIYILAPFLLAPVFTYFYLREIKLPVLGSLLGALTFGYGGMMASPLASNGLIPNAVMWLPLLLIGLERSRSRRLIPCLLAATGAFSMSVLTGVGQGFLYVGLIGFAYALFLRFLEPLDAHPASRLPSHWRPVFVMSVAAALAAGLASFQIFETEQVAQLSIRRTLSYALFTEGSFTLDALWKSIVAPVFYVIDMHPAVTPLALGLAVIAVVAYFRTPLNRDRRILFWLGVALAGLLLMLGSSSPIYPLIYQIPVINRFRVPSRHVFEWTFAIGVLAAYGWAACNQLFERIRQSQKTAWINTYVAVALLGAGVVVGVMWWRAVQAFPDTSLSSDSSLRAYVAWKAAFVLLTAIAAWRVSLISRSNVRRGLLIAVVLTVSYVEPHLLISRWWGQVGFTAERFTVLSDATRYLQQFPSAENRVYTRTDLMMEQFESQPRFDRTNLSAIHGLQDVGGYEPLVLERYSRALGHVILDGVNTFRKRRPDPSLLTTRSHVLDILNTTFVVSYSNLATSISSPGEPGAPSTMTQIGEVLPGTTKLLVVEPTNADTVFSITSLANATAEVDGEVVARIRLFTPSGGMLEKEIQVGRDTAEWAHERPDVKPFIKHQLAPVYDTNHINAKVPFAAYRFKTVVTFDRRLTVSRIEITNVSTTARLAIYGMSLVNSRTGATTIVGLPYSELWEPVHDENSLLILRNKRVRPRVWLVAEAESVTSEQALARIRGETAEQFDPERTALLELPARALPKLPGGPLTPGSNAQLINYEPNRLAIKTNSTTPTLLIVSEIFFPGWVAFVDGQPTEILTTNYVLRGIPLPAGQHEIELRYLAPEFRKGLTITAVTLVMLLGLVVINVIPRFRGRSVQS